MQPITFVYFDFGSVLVRQNLFDEVAKITQQDPYAVYTVYAQYDADACRGVLSKDDFFRLFIAHFPGFETPLNTLIDSVYSTFNPIVETHDLLAALKSRYRIGLASNMWTHTYEKFAPMMPRISFDSILLSCDVGYIKPEKEFYALATQKAGVEPEEIFFIDDKEENIAGAKQFGWEGLVFNEQEPEASVARLKALLLP